MPDLLAAIATNAANLADFLEGKRGLHRQRHQDHLGPAIASIKDVMAGYFRAQGAAVLHAVKPHIATVSTQFREADGKRFASTLVPDSLHPLRFPIVSAENAIYEAAITAAIVGAAEVLSEELGSGAVLAPNVAGNYLRENSLSKLTGDISETSKDRLRNALADAWEKGGSYDQLVAAVTDTFETFGTVRAGMIAQTEGNRAYNQGRIETAKAWGADEQSWEIESSNPCELCIENEDAGWIDADEDFPNGNEIPLHVGCMCTMNFRKTSGDENE